MEVETARQGEFPDARYQERFHPFAGETTGACLICGADRKHKSHHDQYGFWGYTTLHAALNATGRWVFEPTKPGRPKKQTVEPAASVEATVSGEAKP
jgi:hypothetical protein